jgi:hypothetical protein
MHGPDATVGSEIFSLTKRGFSWLVEALDRPVLESAGVLIAE